MQNRVTLIGNLGSDVQVTQIESGNKIARVSLATNEFYRDKEGNRVVNTQWHKIVGWGAKADSMKKHLAKGSQVIVHGRLVHRTYEDSNGDAKYLSEVVVQNFEAMKKAAS